MDSFSLCPDDLQDLLSGAQEFRYDRERVHLAADPDITHCESCDLPYNMVLNGANDS